MQQFTRYCIGWCATMGEFLKRGLTQAWFEVQTTVKQGRFVHRMDADEDHRLKYQKSRIKQYGETFQVVKESTKTTTYEPL
uniref:Uncharacterized protein n=1 Tax=Romanomermis culicivorax TaxID=13658 RepID=A0A915KEP5_ROMCU